jgi:hypothetical protein
MTLEENKPFFIKCNNLYKQLGGGGNVPQKINLDEPNWSLLGCRTYAKMIGKFKQTII